MRGEEIDQDGLVCRVHEENIWNIQSDIQYDRLAMDTGIRFVGVLVFLRTPVQRISIF